jgi:hypothetical protein
MTDPFPNPDRSLDRAVRAKLDADARNADPETVLAGVRQRLEADTVSPGRRSRRWVFAAAGALAASVLVAVLLLIPGGSVQASPREVVERAKAVHETPTDRCYEVTVHFPDDLRERYPKLAADRKSRLWTRGDRYFVELPDGRGSWGRDEMGRVWITPTSNAGARFDPEEVPGILREFFEVRTVQLPRLLDELLSDCDLAWTPTDPGRSRGDRKIVATKRTPNGSALLGAEVDIAADSNVITRLAVTRQTFLHKVTTEFRLVAAEPPDESMYSPEGHLIDGAPIYDRTQALRRLPLLVKYLGPLNGDKKP